MANIRKRPTEVIAIRVPKTLLKFFKTLKNRNEYFLQIIDESQKYKDYLKKQAELERKNEPSLFDNL